MYQIFDAYLGGPPRDWSAEMLKGFKALEEQGKAAQKKAEAERVKGTSPSLALDKYAGVYESEMYGGAQVALESGKLVARFGPNFTGDLEHWHYDTFRVTWRDRSQGKALVSFSLTPQGKVGAMNIEGIADFTRAPEKPAAAAASSAAKQGDADLRKFVGKYAHESAALEASVELVGNILKVVVPGQPAYTLVPDGANRFRIEGAPDGYFAQFEMAEGRPKSVTLVQGPGQSFVLLYKP